LKIRSRSLAASEPGAAGPLGAELASGARGRRWVLLFLLVGLTLLWFWPSLRAFCELTWRHDQYTHILLVLPLSIGLAFLKGSCGPATGRTDPWVGLAFFLPAAVLAWYGSGPGGSMSESTCLSLNMLALVLLWLSFVMLIFGLPVFRRFRFPLLLLLLLVPLPDFVLSKIIFALQAGSAKIAFWLFRLTGIPVTQSGFVLSLPGLDIEVAQECSGIRSTMMLLLTSLALGYMFLKAGWQRIVVTLGVVPIAVIKNGVRIFVLTTLGLYVDEGWLNGRLHHQGGIVFFALGVGLVGLTIWALHRIGRGWC